MNDRVQPLIIPAEYSIPYIYYTLLRTVPNLSAASQFSILEDEFSHTDSSTRKLRCFRIPILRRENCDACSVRNFDEKTAIFGISESVSAVLYWYIVPI